MLYYPRVYVFDSDPHIKFHDFQFKFKIWLEGPNDFTFGPGDVKLLTSLCDTENLTTTSKDLGYSYKYGWQKLKQMTKKTGRDVVTTSKGGKGGGGNVKITQWGKFLIQMFEQAQLKLDQLAKEMNPLPPFEKATK